MRIFDGIRRLLWKLIPIKDIEEVFKVKITTSETMLREQELWRNIYAGKAPWNKDVPSMLTAASLCSRVSKICDLEKKWDISGSLMADFMNAQFKRFMDGAKNGLRHAFEKGCKGGKLLFFPAVRGKVVIINVHENNFYYPVRRDEFGRLVEVVLKSQITDGEYVYTLLSKYNYLEPARGTPSLEIINRAFKNRINDVTSALGSEINLSHVNEWRDVESQTIIGNVTRPWFTEFQMPQNNHIEECSPDGVAIFSKAVDLIRKLDMQKARTEREYRGGELKVFVPADMWEDIGKKNALNPREGEVKFAVPEGDEGLYVMSGIASNEIGITQYNPAFRDESLERGSNAIKRDIEIACELAFGTISDAAIQARTATEIESTQVVTFSTIGDIQQSMETALHEVAEIMREIAYAYDLAPWGEYEFHLEWGDGIPEDEGIERARTLEMMSNGLYTPAQALAKIDKISEEEAAGRLPGAFGDGDA